MDSKAIDLDRVLRKYAATLQAIIMHDEPDPDSLASAQAHAKLASMFNIKSDILYVEPISRDDNRAMVDLLRIPAIQIDPKEYDFSKYDGYVLVDTQVPPKEVCSSLNGRIPLISVVDHHIIHNPRQSLFRDIRTDVTAASTIYAHYLRANGRLKWGDLEDRLLGTALSLGISTDTKDGEIPKRYADISAQRYLEEFTDYALVKKILETPLRKDIYDLVNKAVSGKKNVNDYLISNIGDITKEDRCAIHIAADRLCKVPATKLAIAYGIIGNVVDGSIRTNDPELNTAEWLKDYLRSAVDGSLEVSYMEFGGRPCKGGFRFQVVAKDIDTINSSLSSGLEYMGADSLARITK